MFTRNVTFRTPEGDLTKVEMPDYSFNENPSGVWFEYAISDCPLGCKVYENKINLDLALMHNSNYGCRR